MGKKPNEHIKPITHGLISSALFLLLSNGVPPVIAFLASLAAYFAGYPPHLVIIIGGVVLIIFLVAMHLLRSQLEKRRQLRGGSHDDASQSLQTTQHSAEEVGKLEIRIKELEHENLVLDTARREKIEELKTLRAKIEQLEKDLVDMGKALAVKGYEKEDEIDGLKYNIDRLNSKYGWLSEIAEKERKAIGKYVTVESCTVDSGHLHGDMPYLVFDFNVLNNSVYTISVSDSIDGFIRFMGHPLDRPATMHENQMKDCPHGKRNYFRIRQRIEKPDVPLIHQTLKESGNLFDFSGLIVNISTTDERLVLESARLDLTRGMQHVDLENKSIVLENEIKQLRQELKEKEKQERRNAALTIAVVVAQTLYAELDEGKPIREQRLARWRSEAMDMLAVHFGNDVAIKVFGSGNYRPPSAVSEQREWLNDCTKKLRDVPINQ